MTVEVLLDSSTIGLVISSEFQGFKLKKIERLIYEKYGWFFQ